MVHEMFHQLGRRVDNSRWRRGLLSAGTLLGVCLLFVSVQTAFAYVLLGGRWPNQPTSGCCASLGVVVAGPMMGHDMEAWSDGLSAWNNSPANIIYNSVGFGQSSILATDTSNSSVTWDGIATLNPCLSCTYSSANLLLNNHYTRNYSLAQTQAVAAHELGHLAGLDHADGCVLMNPYTNQRWNTCGVNQPTNDDVDGVNALY